MTVETETVSSIPQAALGGATVERAGAGRVDTNGSLRMKPSTETIRPKKDRKKAARKAPSINSGTASSKADIFEARVASAVDQADSSDSDETFVYESNPLDQPVRPARHHSRTPSATSVVSQVDQQRNGVRSFVNALDSHSVAGKRSMKFVKNPANNLYGNVEGDHPIDRQNGTVRASHSRTGGGSVHSNHIGRFGRGPGNHTGLFDSESPFSQASKIRQTVGNTSRHSSRPSTPKFSLQNNLRLGLASKRSGDISSYDVDGEGADDERTPLVGTVRTSRTVRTARRPNSGSQHQMDYYQQRERRWITSLAGGIVTFIMVVLVVLGAVGFFYSMTKPMYEVHIEEIQNVLASEQEIMLDLLVGAVNPNIIAVTIADLDVNVFAKSKHVGTENTSREHRPRPFLDQGPLVPRRSRIQQKPTTPVLKHSWQDLVGHWHPRNGVDEGTDPMPDPEVGDPQTMLLGRVTQFDTVLTFDGSPLKRHSHYSVGELRLAKPGNKTEGGGTERWERIIQYPFELIVRGVLKYTLPLSTNARTAAIVASVEVHPEEGLDTYGNMRIQQIRKVKYWDWVELDKGSWEEDKRRRGLGA
ncbi:hypothetical protein B0A49_06381 [Cryomyces minteri]|uniref:Uncharacterized protein n=1 Tax=Cryomyces minteri TaxID=331657 RepID=A0A4V5NFH4_9PEZI|nr:hypothetical protein B0A49_06381 [Cryomyces minteri]